MNVTRILEDYKRRDADFQKKYNVSLTFHWCLLTRKRPKYRILDDNYEMVLQIL